MLGTKFKMKVSLGRWQCESCSEFAANLYSRPLHPILESLSSKALPGPSSYKELEAVVNEHNLIIFTIKCR